MADQDSAAVVRQLFDAFNGHDLDQVEALASDNVEFTDVAAGQQIHGHQEWRQYSETWLKAFPDMHLDLVNLVAAGDLATCEAVARGTHTGPLDTPMGEIAPTGRTVEERLCLFVRVRDGKIVDSREYYDAMTLMAQLGITPQPAQTSTI